MAEEVYKVYQLPYKNDNWQAEEGFALSRWRDDGWGDLVADGKAAEQFSDDLIAPFIQMIESMSIEQRPCWITYVPASRHPTLVKNFAHKLVSVKYTLCRCCVIAKEKAPQKLMENSYRRIENLDGMFVIDQAQIYDDPVFLLDDVVDSGWTFTIVTALLKRANAGRVYPVALTSTSKQG